LLNVIDVVDYLLLGSKLGEIILAEKGVFKNRGLPKIDLLKKIDLENSKLHIPVDGNIGPKDLGSINKEMADVSKEYIRKADIETMKRQEEVYDIGPETIKMFSKIIKRAKTILWNGPLGMYENKRFEDGTKEIAHSIIKNQSALKIAGGGETTDAIGGLGLIEKFDFISTGGGAMLKFLAGQELAGIKCLKDANKTQ
jgi:phosphoglycerate kinase